MTTSLTWNWSRGRRVALYNAIVELEARGADAVLTGTGSPEGSVTAAVEAFYVDTTGALGVWLWVKATGTGNTGWKEVSPALGYDDLRVSLAMATRGVTPPSLDVFKDGTKAYAFSASAVNEVFFDVQLPHRWVLGTDIMPHVHYAVPTAGNGTTDKVRWVFEHSWANYADAFPTSTVMTAVDDLAATTAYEHQIASLGTITGTGKRASSVLMCRLARVGNAAEDTYTGVAFGLSVDFHIQTYGNGGPTEFAGAT